MSNGHDKQRALLLLDMAAGHLSSGRLDGAFTLATPPRMVREFDDRLYGVYR
ncbi:hypothetical protein ABT381_05630 [Streptomyces sp. NPDC000151]|uniref:hypothetical protein n=1 Tax=Streptomyces sp. NPDC000151 TaxID=3154244 RepID=UPI00332E80FF